MDKDKIPAFLILDGTWKQARKMLRKSEVLQDLPGEIIMVSNEVGMGIIPQGAISRWFVDEAGRLQGAELAVGIQNADDGCVRGTGGCRAGS